MEPSNLIVINLLVLASYYYLHIVYFLYIQFIYIAWTALLLSLIAKFILSWFLLGVVARVVKWSNVNTTTSADALMIAISTLSDYHSKHHPAHFTCNQKNKLRSPYFIFIRCQVATSKQV
jgi:hypothetical protein